MAPADPAVRLNRFAAFAFCAEMSRVLSHCEPVGESPLFATAQTMPLLSTIVAHMSLWSPTGEVSMFCCSVCQRPPSWTSTGIAS
jgi:hypothetical protein